MTLRNDKAIAFVLILPTTLAFITAAAEMAFAGYWVSPIFYAASLPLVIRSVWRDRA